MDTWHLIIRPHSARQITTDPRYGKPRPIWVLNGVHSEWTQAAPSSDYAHQIANLQFSAARAIVGLYLPTSVLASAASDARRKAAIKHYIGATFASDARHHLRHWWSQADLKHYMLIVSPEWIK